MKRARLLACVLAGAAVLSGCVVEAVQVGEEGPQCEIDLDCERPSWPDAACVEGVCQPRPPTPDWRCLDEPPLATSSRIVDLRLRVVGAISRLPAVGALVRACGRIDANCSPESALVKDTPVNAAGEVILQVPESFNGYFEVRSPPAEPDKFVPEIVYLPPREIVRASSNEGTPRGALLFTAAEASNLTRLVGGSFDVEQPPNAFAFATVVDCRGELSPGISFELTTPGATSAKTRGFYNDKNNLPRTEATETSEAGTFALTNLVASSTAGPVGLSATVNTLQRPMGNDSVFLVRDNWMAAVYVTPP